VRSGISILGLGAQSDPPQISQPEAKKVIDAFKSLDTVRSSGVTIAGCKFFTLQATDRSIYGKKGVRADSHIVIVNFNPVCRQTAS